MGIVYEILKDKTKAKEVWELKQSVFLSATKQSKFNDSEESKAEDDGFIIGDHSVEDFSNWIASADDKIYIAIDEETQKIVGYAVLLDNEDTRSRISNYAKNMEIIVPKFEKIVKNDNYVYLIQIAFSSGYQKQGLGSQLMRFIILKESKPIISYVMEKPLLNKPSIYFHLKNGFIVVGHYLGEYGEFDDYKSICFLYDVENIKLSDKEVKKQFTRLIKET